MRNQYVVSLEVQCDKCGSYLNVDLRDDTIYVKPCEECIETAETNSYESGRQDGYDAGTEEGNEAGYDRGYKDGQTDGYQEGLREGGEQ